MSKVIADISISIDGFVTGPNPDLEHGLGEGGDALHTWAIESHDQVDRQILREGTLQSGAVVMGRNLFDIIDGPGGWNDEMGYGADMVGTPAFFVVTHSPPEHVRLKLDFTFVTDGVAPAIEKASKVVPKDKDVVVMGGGDVIRQCVENGLVDELRLHISPVILGSGTPLFSSLAKPIQLEQRSVRISPAATHVTYDVKG